MSVVQIRSLAAVGVALPLLAGSAVGAEDKVFISCDFSASDENFGIQRPSVHLGFSVCKTECKLNGVDWVITDDVYGVRFSERAGITINRLDGSALYVEEVSTSKYGTIAFSHRGKCMKLDKPAL